MFSSAFADENFAQDDKSKTERFGWSVLLLYRRSEGSGVERIRGWCGAREIPRPAGESAGLRDDAVDLGMTLVAVRGTSVSWSM